MIQMMGPHVEPWPGPYKGLVEVPLYEVVNVPYIVQMWCVLPSQRVPRQLVTDLGSPSL